MDWEEVNKLCRIGATHEEIAAHLDVSEDTLCRAAKRDHKMNFADYIKKNSQNLRLSLRRAQYKAAIEEGNTTMLIWMGKQYLGQCDTQKIESEVRLEDRRRHSPEEIIEELKRRNLPALPLEE
jgi:IS30 family transposase